MEVTQIITRDRSSGRYHKRYRITEDGQTRTVVDERCQTDQSGGYDVVAAPRVIKGRKELCKYCFDA